ncbi:MAG TPA: DUF2087 domain-containing protein [Ignavibacteria bacterium]|nr:DUF2087 domain-containing protein [Ignavibacteria bacterium]
MSDFILSLKGFLDDDMKLKVWPSKPDKKPRVLGAMEFLASKFEFDKEYAEKEISEIIKANHTFNDHPMLRRDLVNRKLLGRTQNGAKYWREKN